MKCEKDEIGNEYIYDINTKICMAVAKKTDEEVVKLIKKYCEEKGIIPKIIKEEKLDLVLKLGIQQLQLRGEDNE